MKGQQLGLNLNKGKRGGRRSGAGRKRIHSKGVAHRTREKVSGRTPLHINFRFRTSIRNKHCLRLLKRALLNARKQGLRILHFSLQSNHIHLVVEAVNNEVLSRGMRSLTVTFAKGLAQGKVQVERFHLHVLRTVRETRNAIHYVLFNQQKHEKGTCSRIDGYSSLLSMDRAMELIAKFAKDRRATLFVGRDEVWRGDQGLSFLFKQGIESLLTNKKGA